MRACGVGGRWGPEEAHREDGEGEQGGGDGTRSGDRVEDEGTPRWNGRGVTRVGRGRPAVARGKGGVGEFVGKEGLEFNPIFFVLF